MHETDRKLVVQVSALLREHGLSLSLAESCTGGLIADMITNIPGASAFFDSSFVTYSYSAKEEVLGVRKVTIVKEGAVSEDAAREMAEGIRRLRRTDFALSATGNLGPVTQEDKEIGVVFFSVASRHGTASARLEFSGDRRAIKELAAAAGIRFLLEQILVQMGSPTSTVPPGEPQTGGKR